MLGTIGILALSILIAAGQAALLVWGILPLPYILSLVFLGLIVVMGYELSRDVLRAAQLSRELRESGTIWMSVLIIFPKLPSRVQAFGIRVGWRNPAPGSIRQMGCGSPRVNLGTATTAKERSL